MIFTKYYILYFKFNIGPKITFVIIYMIIMICHDKNCQMYINNKLVQVQLKHCYLNILNSTTS